MAFGDVGGPVTELIITCRIPKGHRVIRKGEAVGFIGDYTAMAEKKGLRLFGQAMMERTDDEEQIPLKIRGIARFIKPVIGKTIKVVKFPEDCLIDGHGYLTQVQDRMLMKETDEWIDILL